MTLISRYVIVTLETSKLIVVDKETFLLCTTYLGGFHSYRVWVDTVLKMGLTTEIHKLVNYRVLCLLFDNLMVVTQVK